MRFTTEAQRAQRNASTLFFMVLLCVLCVSVVKY